MASQDLDFSRYEVITWLYDLFFGLFCNKQCQLYQMVISVVNSCMHISTISYGKCRSMSVNVGQCRDFFRYAISFDLTKNSSVGKSSHVGCQKKMPPGWFYKNVGNDDNDDNDDNVVYSFELFWPELSPQTVWIFQSNTTSRCSSSVV